MAAATRSARTRDANGGSSSAAPHQFGATVTVTVHEPSSFRWSDHWPCATGPAGAKADCAACISGVIVVCAAE